MIALILAATILYPVVNDAAVARVQAPDRPGVTTVCLLPDGTATDDLTGHFGCTTVVRGQIVEIQVPVTEAQGHRSFQAVAYYEIVAGETLVSRRSDSTGIAVLLAPAILLGP